MRLDRFLVLSKWRQAAGMARRVALELPGGRDISIRLCRRTWRIVVGVRLSPWAWLAGGVLHVRAWYRLRLALESEARATLGWVPRSSVWTAWKR